MSASGKSPRSLSDSDDDDKNSKDFKSAPQTEAEKAQKKAAAAAEVLRLAKLKLNPSPPSATAASAAASEPDHKALVARRLKNNQPVRPDETLTMRHNPLPRAPGTRDSRQSHIALFSPKAEKPLRSRSADGKAAKTHQRRRSY